MQKVVYAKFNKCGIPPYKVQLVANLIRGKKALAACDILKFTNKAAARDILKVVNSAIANAVNNEGMDKKDLMLVKVAVDNAPMFKRGRATARGRYHQLLKRNSNIIIGLSDGSEISETPKAVKVVKESKSVKEEVKPVKAVAKTVKTKAKTKTDTKLTKKPIKK